MEKILFYLDYIWENIYLKWIIFYIIYAIITYFIITPILKKVFLKVVKKTKTNFDNEIYWKTKWFVKAILYLLWINIVYKFYYLNILDNNFIILYKLIISLEFVLLFFLLKRSIQISLKYAWKKYKNILTKNILNLWKIFSNIIIISVFVLLILNVWWINITPLLASAWIFGLAVAMASKSIIENFLSWLILFADKTINVWDTIILSDNTTAIVEEINIRTTRLRTFDGNIVIIPNSEILNDKIINKSLWELSPYKRVTVNVWISYGDDTEKAKNLLKEYLLELEWADKTSVVTYVDALDNWSVNITWKIMVKADVWSYLMEKEILEKVYKEFPKNNLTFPFPTYELTWQIETKK